MDDKTKRLIEAGKELRDQWTQQLGRFPGIVAGLHGALNRWDAALTAFETESAKPTLSPDNVGLTGDGGNISAMADKAPIRD